MSRLEALGVAKRYKMRQVVKDLSLSIESGEVVGLLCPNGAGKTTAFHMIVGLVRCDQGRIHLAGRDVTKLPVHRRAKLGLGYLPQEASVFRKLSVADNIRAILETRRDLDRAVQQAEHAAGALTVARFSFDGLADSRAEMDAARLFGRLVRDTDFACREQDGTILAAFTETDLRSAHVVARRIAGVLRQTMLSPGRDRGSIQPTITLATTARNR